jgi:hypothetical protein
MTRVVRRGRRQVGASIVIACSATVGAGCQHDGRDLREPSAPLPATTTTSTTLPPDVARP